jgi:hypothetical protein
MTEAAHLSDVALGASDSLPTIRPMRAADRPKVLRDWAEGYKDSPRCRRKVWSDFKRADRPVLDECLARPDTTVIVADLQGAPVGWMAFCRGQSIDLIHWIYVTLAQRRRRVMAQLVAAAQLKQRLAYTHEAAVPRRAGERADVWIARWLRAGGRFVSHVPYQEWSK